MTGRERRIFAVAMFSLAVICLGVGSYSVLANLFTPQSVSAKVHIHGNVQISISPATLDFGNITTGVASTQYFNVTNVGNVQDNNLNFTVSMGNLPGGSSLNLGSCFVSSPPPGSSFYTINGQNVTSLCQIYPTGVAIAHVLPAHYTEGMALTLIVGPGASDNATYTFSVTDIS